MEEKKLKAIFDFDPKNNELCLSFKTGDVITLLAKEDPEWWEGELNG